jgi:hypothetical protein
MMTSSLSSKITFALMGFSLFALPARAALDDERALDQREDALRELDISSGHEFKRVGQGTTVLNFKVKNTATGKNVANLKCTEGNTYAPAAVAVYRLGRATGFNIYPVAVTARAEQLPAQYRGQQCVLKEWSGNFGQFNWNRDHLASSAADYRGDTARILKCDPLRGDNEVRIAPQTSYGSFVGKPDDGAFTYVMNSTMRNFARDFGNMMLIDAVLGNDDRFPGGNIHLRATEGTVEFDARSRTVELNGGRLFSLDNEASMKRFGGGNAMGDLTRSLRAYDARLLNALQDDRVIEAAFQGLRTKDGRDAVAMAKSNIAKIVEHFSSVRSCRLD